MLFDDPDDPFTLSRFVQAQARDYETALQELKGGQKRSHWMWYIFPQFKGLGSSSTSMRFAIRSPGETETPERTARRRRGKPGLWGNYCLA